MTTDDLSPATTRIGGDARAEQFWPTRRAEMREFLGSCFISGEYANLVLWSDHTLGPKVAYPGDWVYRDEFGRFEVFSTS